MRESMRIRKMMIFVILVCISFTYIFCPGTALLEKYSEEKSNNQDNALTAYFNLIHYFSGTNNELSLPAFYCGSYINDNNDLVVLLNDFSEINQHLIYNACDSRQIVFQKANYSYNTLYSELKSIEKRIIDYDEFGYVTYEICETQNKIIVGIVNMEDDLVDLFKAKISNAEYIVFEPVDKFNEQSGNTLRDELTDIRPGSFLDTVSGSGSLGFRAKKNVNGTIISGFVTANHVINSTQRNAYRGNTKIGEYYCGQNSGTIDASFVQYTSTYSLTNITPSGDVLSTSWFTSIPEGTTVYLSGKTSPHAREGEVKSNSFSFYVASDGISYSDMIRSSYSSDNGDSGGVVYASYGGVNCLVGIHQGICSIIYAISNRAVCSKASNIMDTLGIYPY